MARRRTPTHLIQYLDRKLGAGAWLMPVDDSTAAPFICMMNDDISMENMSEDGELSQAELRDKMEDARGIYSYVMRAKGDLELIVGHRIVLDNID